MGFHYDKWSCAGTHDAHEQTGPERWVYSLPGAIVFGPRLSWGARRLRSVLTLEAHGLTKVERRVTVTEEGLEALVKYPLRPPLGHS